MENNIDEDEKLELDASPVNLNDEIESEDDELPPPEDEKDEARELNVGNILALIFIGVAVIFLIVMAAGSAKSKKKVQSLELDKSGSKITFGNQQEKAELKMPSAAEKPAAAPAKKSTSAGCHHSPPRCSNTSRTPTP